ncbi:hypothetical protein ACUXCC_004119 [Cytobacillus horneckiae]|uniref:Uncharacterized protein n=1 Tax=Cytobacillus horneckiae TaxID=549687 RepID=A0A2N0ZHP1_9BACI|nr:hypothetical protein [Cytobacillus horneckiae]MBN6886983.1 hypothetical protein [Cytobacillus horneckiae]MEC1157851.1 hypothetical protein [Cytobacillus horneckiae]PKG29045.1 hypothetical protein CWS20_09760 [Cytobacillus horneckiae]
MDKRKLKSNVSAVIKNFELENHDLESWYYAPALNEDTEGEQFTYIVSGTEPKMGSNLKMMIYVENNEKGLLMMANGKQYYLAGEESIFDEVRKK